jgi:hypothetical protein
MRPEVTHPGRLAGRARYRIWLTAAALFAAGSAAFLATGQLPGALVPLSFRLVEQIPSRTGIAFQHQNATFAPYFDNVRPILAAVSASACTADIDRDGDLDLYFTTAGDGARNALFLNDGQWRFHRADLPALDGHNGPEGFSSDCTFADVDNDGWDDLLVLTVGQRPRLFHNQQGHSFVDVTDASGLPDYLNAFAAAFADLDRDGDLDLICASYFAERYREEDIPGAPPIHPRRVPSSEHAGRVMPNNWGNATNGGRKHLLLNDGAGHFAEQSLATWGLSDTRFTFDIAAADLNLDGATDLFFANDFGPDQLYLSTGHGRFVEQRGRVPTDIGRDSFKGMNAEVADIDGDGYPEIFVTNVFHPILPEGNLLWKNLPAGPEPTHRAFQNVAAPLGVNDAGWGWGGAFTDLDLDGFLDLVVASGYISQGEGEYWYRLATLVSGDSRLIVDSRQWPPVGNLSLSGHELSHVFVWSGHRFVDRGREAGLERPFDARGTLVADFDGDGRPDVLFVAQNGPYFLGRNAFRSGPGQSSPPHFVGVVLEGDGVRVNTDAVGAHVVVQPSKPRATAPPPLHREITIGNGMSAQGMRWVLAGLGSYADTVDVTIRWPDGTSERHRGLAPDRYHTFRRADSPVASSW